MYVLRIHVEAGGVYFKIHFLQVAGALLMSLYVCPVVAVLKKDFFLNRRVSDFSRYSD